MHVFVIGSSIFNHIFEMISKPLILQKLDSNWTPNIGDDLWKGQQSCQRAQRWKGSLIYKVNGISWNLVLCINNPKAYPPLKIWAAIQTTKHQVRQTHLHAGPRKVMFRIWARWNRLYNGRIKNCYYGVAIFLIWSPVNNTLVESFLFFLEKLF